MPLRIANPATSDLAFSPQERVTAAFGLHTYYSAGGRNKIDIAAYQRAMSGLTTDGIVGPATKARAEDLLQKKLTWPTIKQIEAKVAREVAYYKSLWQMWGLKSKPSHLSYLDLEWIKTAYFNREKGWRPKDKNDRERFLEKLDAGLQYLANFKAGIDRKETVQQDLDYHFHHKDPDFLHKSGELITAIAPVLLPALSVVLAVIPGIGPVAAAAIIAGAAMATSIAAGDSAEETIKKGINAGGDKVLAAAGAELVGQFRDTQALAALGDTDAIKKLKEIKKDATAEVEKILKSTAPAAAELIKEVKDLKSLAALGDSDAVKALQEFKKDANANIKKILKDTAPTAADLKSMETKIKTALSNPAAAMVLEKNRKKSDAAAALWEVFSARNCARFGISA